PARLPRGRVPRVRQRGLHARPAAHLGAGRPSRPRVVPAVLGRQGGPGRDPEAAHRGVHPGLACTRGDGAGGPGSRRPAVEGVRAMTVVAPARSFLSLVKIEHSVFALPFAYLSALTVMAHGRVRWLDLALITVAMVGARTFAMAANRIIDRHIDARNPRTAGRELVTGVVSVRTAWAGALVALVVFLGAAALLNP